MTHQRTSLKSLVTTILCQPLVGRCIGWWYANRIPHRGRRFQVPPNGDPKIVAWLFWGIYESAEIRLINRHLPTDGDVVELGSSLGVVTCQIDAAIDAARKIVAVEPNPTILPILRQNLQTHARRQNYQVVQGAISYCGSPTIPLEIGSSNLTSRLGVAPNDRTVDVPTVTLSQLLSDHRINDFSLVCDIEGAEAALFDRDSAAFDRCQCLIIELHHPEYQGQSLTPESLVTWIESRTPLRLVATDGRAAAFKPQH